MLLYTVFFQDTGKPVRNANTTISIRVNSARSTLKFSKSLYVADCRSAEVEKVKYLFLNILNVTSLKKMFNKIVWE